MATGSVAKPVLAVTKETSADIDQAHARWLVIGVFALSSVLNYLDRQLLAAVAPMLRADFHLSNAQYGGLISAFSLPYMLVAPIAGLLIDRIGANTGIILAVGVWSLAGSASSIVSSFRGLAVCRMVLGVAEAGSIPCGSKASASYLRPRELSIGNAINSVGITLGSIAAPILVAIMAPRFGWQSVFLVAGGLGFVWILLWLPVSRSFPPHSSKTAASSVRIAAILRNRQFWAILVANTLIMALYSLWMNWTTVYLVEDRHLTLAEANRYFAWIPPVFASLGGFFGGWLAFRFIRQEDERVQTRLRLCWRIAPLLLVTAVIPFLPTTAAATAGICVSFFTCMTILINLHVIPIDLFGAERAAFTASLLTFSYALAQTVVSPLIGAMVDNFGFTAVCIVLSAAPLLGIGILRGSIR